MQCIPKIIITLCKQAMVVGIVLAVSAATGQSRKKTTYYINYYQIFIIDAILNSFKDFDGDYALLFSKKGYMLSVYNRNCQLITHYKAGYGRNPDMLPKLYEGDNRTPEGIYTITEILSLDANPATDAYKKLVALNNIYLKASEGFHKYGDPTADTGKGAYGPRYYHINYPNKADEERYDEALKKGLIPLQDNGEPTGIGYGITIHGNNDLPSVGTLSTSGCIIMYNDDIIDIEQYIEEGTPVIIAPD